MAKEITNQKKILDLLNEYSLKNNLSVHLESNLYDVSKDDSENKASSRHFQTRYQDLTVISMDEFAHKVLTPIHCNGSNAECNALASVDGFVIDKNGIWNFIEFKNQKIRNAKEKCIEKAFSNLYWLFDVLFKMKKDGVIIDFDYENPTKFVKERCKFILVIGNGCDDLTIGKIRNAKKINSKQLEFWQKLENYIFKEVLVLNEELFDGIFVKNFKQ